MKNRFFSNLSFLTFNNILQILVPLITTPLIASNLGVQGFGLLGLYLSIIVFIDKLSELSYTWTAARDIHQTAPLNRNYEILVKFLAQILVWMFLIIIVFVAGFMGLLRYHSFDIFLLIIIYSILLLLTVPWYFLQTESLVNYSIYYSISRLIFLCSIILFINETSSVQHVLVIYVISTLPSAFLGMMHIVKIIGTTHAPPLSAVFQTIIKLRYSIFVKILTSTYTTIPLIFLSHVVTEQQLGIFHLASKYKTLVQSFVLQYSNLLTQKIAKINFDYEFYRSRTRKLAALGLFISVLVTAVAMLLSKYVILGLFGNEFSESIGLTYILVSVIPIIYISNHIGVQKLILNNKDNLLFKAIVVAGLVIIPSMIVLTNLHGTHGTASAILFAEILVLIAVYVELRKSENV